MQSRIFVFIYFIILAEFSVGLYRQRNSRTQPRRSQPVYNQSPRAAEPRKDGNGQFNMVQNRRMRQEKDHGLRSNFQQRQLKDYERDNSYKAKVQPFYRILQRKNSDNAYRENESKDNAIRANQKTRRHSDNNMAHNIDNGMRNRVPVQRVNRGRIQKVDHTPTQAEETRDHAQKRIQRETSDLKRESISSTGQSRYNPDIQAYFRDIQRRNIERQAQRSNGETMKRSESSNQPQAYQRISRDRDLDEERIRKLNLKRVRSSPSVRNGHENEPLRKGSIERRQTIQDKVQPRAVEARMQTNMNGNGQKTEKKRMNWRRMKRNEKSQDMSRTSDSQGANPGVQRDLREMVPSYSNKKLLQDLLPRRIQEENGRIMLDGIERRNGNGGMARNRKTFQEEKREVNEEYLKHHRPVNKRNGRDNRKLQGINLSRIVIIDKEKLEKESEETKRKKRQALENMRNENAIKSEKQNSPNVQRRNAETDKVLKRKSEQAKRNTGTDQTLERKAKQAKRNTGTDQTLERKAGQAKRNTGTDQTLERKAELTKKYSPDKMAQKRQLEAKPANINHIKQSNTPSQENHQTVHQEKNQKRGLPHSINTQVKDKMDLVNKDKEVLAARKKTFQEELQRLLEERTKEQADLSKKAIGNGIQKEEDSNLNTHQERQVEGVKETQERDVYEEEEEDQDEEYIENANEDLNYKRDVDAVGQEPDEVENMPEGDELVYLNEDEGESWQNMDKRDVEAGGREPDEVENMPEDDELVYLNEDEDMDKRDDNSIPFETEENFPDNQAKYQTLNEDRRSPGKKSDQEYLEDESRNIKQETFETEKRTAGISNEAEFPVQSKSAHQQEWIEIENKASRNVEQTHTELDTEDQDGVNSNEEQQVRKRLRSTEYEQDHEDIVAGNEDHSSQDAIKREEPVEEQQQDSTKEEGGQLSWKRSTAKEEILQGELQVGEEAKVVDEHIAREERRLKRIELRKKEVQDRKNEMRVLKMEEIRARRMQKQVESKLKRIKKYEHELMVNGTAEPPCNYLERRGMKNLCGCKFPQNCVRVYSCLQSACSFNYTCMSPTDVRRGCRLASCKENEMCYMTRNSSQIKPRCLPINKTINKPGFCPVLKSPYGSIKTHNETKECLFDSDCSGHRKCCQLKNTVHKMCTEPVADIKKPGVCPPDEFLTLLNAHDPCTDDRDCPMCLKCCGSEEVRRCFRPLSQYEKQKFHSLY